MASAQPIEELAARVFGDLEYAGMWLERRCVFLGGQTPAELIEDGREEDVRRYLHQIEEGVYI